MEDIFITKKQSRRHFLSRISYGAGGLILLGNYGFTITKDSRTGVIRAISVDFEKCTGCRTCESVCAEYNNKVMVNGALVILLNRISGFTILIRILIYPPPAPYAMTHPVLKHAPWSLIL